mmetsp:Transcript_6225/g.6426  ORF Transcript_6225/g.6426 Transcript_6225/m.6426 type:complete len:679 (-) Transcript_6225:222-2258(-)|eukprot:CAMPEP_0182424488 /NCGR_PEP_ID=MMETSP1167-20130531/10695_1 /TAXON_ID=2988 /ORGANISM="Mallomonas Sp, Strain CCMP3275" /LENGTH=678 /DNA_ID=CAMNT_0024604337 /DNA_START=101 /DNA_END=2140 /DNA_ORIENTATION=-
MESPTPHASQSDASKDEREKGNDEGQGEKSSPAAIQEEPVVQPGKGDKTDQNLAVTDTHAEKNKDDGHGQNGHGHGHGAPEYDPNEVLVGYEKILEDWFRIRERRSSIKIELIAGVVQFVSCSYVLPVIPAQFAPVGYDRVSSVVATCAAMGIGCILGSFLTNMPLIIAPPASVSIFFAIYLEQNQMEKYEGNAGTVLSGALLILIGYRPLGRFVAKLIPHCIQASTSVGIGMLTALAGAVNAIPLVVTGRYTILDMGEITGPVIIGMFAFVLLGILAHHHIKGAFCVAMFFGSFLYWITENDWPAGVVGRPYVEDHNIFKPFSQRSGLLAFNIIFLYILTLNGLARAFSDLAGLTKPDGSIPRGRWIYIVCGITTIISGFMSGPPILISPESAAGIKAGGRTGFSTLVAGLLFCITCFFSPLVAGIPGPGIAPLLMAVGVVLFANVRKIDWSQMDLAFPAYSVIFFIPFTFSILRGIAFGYVIYILMGLGTGSLYYNCLDLWEYYKGSLTCKCKDDMTPTNVLHDIVAGFELNDKDVKTSFEDAAMEAHIELEMERHEKESKRGDEETGNVSEIPGAPLQAPGSRSSDGSLRHRTSSLHEGPFTRDRLFSRERGYSTYRARGESSLSQTHHPDDLPSTISPTSPYNHRFSIDRRQSLDRTHTRDRGASFFDRDIEFL